jgi:putative NADH-flavin reductase
VPAIGTTINAVVEITQMKVALIGASGQVGSRVLKELVLRGHHVQALNRHPENIPLLAGVKATAVDVGDVEALAAALKGCEAAISAVKFKDFDGQQMIAAMRAGGIRRYLVVGGAGSLEVSPGLLEMDNPKFPSHVRPEAQKGAAYLQQLRDSELDWTFLSPSRSFVVGERTGKFRLGKDQLLFDAAGKSSISFEDYAIALVDELERPRHVKERFTVGY